MGRILTRLRSERQVTSSRQSNGSYFWRLICIHRPWEVSPTGKEFLQSFQGRTINSHGTEEFHTQDSNAREIFALLDRLDHVPSHNYNRVKRDAVR